MPLQLHWSQFVTALTYQGRIVAVDLPGHGHTTRDETRDHSCPNLVLDFRHFLEELGLTACAQGVHLLGISLGGAVAGSYASLFPRGVRSVTLICPAGINAPKKSRFVHLLERGVNPLVPQTREEFERMLQLAFHTPPPIPSR